MSEWAQPNERFKHPSTVHKNAFGDAAAFCLNDIEIETLDRQRLHGADCLTVDWTEVNKLWVTFRTQKNGQHGERKLLSRNMGTSGYCGVKAFYNIMKRFAKLCGTWSVATPLGVYFSEIEGRPLMITANCIERHMRTIAAEVYSLDPVTRKKEVNRWSSHSLRVGACVLLHTQGFTTPQIQFLLWWRSDSFKVYLRNVKELVDQQNRAFDNAAALPNFL